ncbi:MAG: type II secretion system protein [Acidobacteria bacterium]|nr:type II secretion system protein [Acidobacteriota bacterium]
MGNGCARRERGLTLLELVVATAILMVLATMALPLARVKIKSDKEIELRRALREMRTAIDRYKDAADRSLIAVKADTEGYPPDLETLVEGVQLAGKPDRRVRFLRRIPTDPMTNSTEWGLRCVQDEPDSRFWCGDDVFDVYSRSSGTALDGTRYNEW